MESLARIIIVLVLVDYAFAADDSIIHHEKKLLADLLKDYNKFVRPVKDTQKSLEVKFGTSLQHISDTDEGKDTITLNEWHNIEWTDFQLQWDPQLYGNIRSIRIQPEMVWKPDIDPYNGGHADYDNAKHAAVVVYSSGLVSFVPKQIMTYSCTFDIAAFPFDTQICRMKYGSWTYDGSKLNLTLRMGNIDLSTYTSNKEWDLKSTSCARNVVLYECCPEPYIDITCTLEISRHTTHYMHAMVAPSLALALLLPTLFVLPPDSNAKMTLGVGILVCNAVLMGLVQMNIPKSGFSLPIIGHYFLANMILCAFSMIMAAFVMNIWKKGNRATSLPSVIRTVVLGVFGKVCCVRKHTYMAVEEGANDKETTENVARNTNTAEWRQLAIILDRICFLVFLILSMLMCLIFVRA